MKANLYYSLTNSNSQSYESAGIKKSEAAKEINNRHGVFNSDKRATAKEQARVFADWLNVFKRQPASQRMVQQFNVDTLEKCLNYLSPITVNGTPATITSSDKRAAESLLPARTNSKTGKTYYIVPMVWTISALESAVKYSAEYNAGLKPSIADKFNAIK